MNFISGLVSFVVSSITNLYETTSGLLELTGVNFIKILEFDNMIVAFNIKKSINTNYNYGKIINQYNTIYKLGWCWRVVIYSSIYYTTRLINAELFSTQLQLSDVLAILFVIPDFQNTIINWEVITNYLNTINYFINNEINIYTRYLISKNIIIVLRSLTNIKINNSNIFKLMVVIDWDFTIEWIQNLIFVWCLMILRSFEITYYYYKGIKLSYYYKMGYYINKMETSHAISYYHDIVKNRKWSEINKIEYVTPLYNIIYNTIHKKIDNTYDIIKYHIIKYIVLWSWINWLINRNFMQIALLIVIKMINYNGNIKIERMVIYFITLFTNYNNSINSMSDWSYYFISFGLCFVFTIRKLLYIILSDTLFYIINYRSIITVYKSTTQT